MCVLPEEGDVSPTPNPLCSRGWGALPTPKPQHRPVVSLAGRRRRLTLLTDLTLLQDRTPSPRGSADGSHGQPGAPQPPPEAPGTLSGRASSPSPAPRPAVMTQCHPDALDTCHLRRGSRTGLKKRRHRYWSPLGPCVLRGWCSVVFLGLLATV